MLNLIAIAAAGVLGWLGQSWLWIIPLAPLATFLHLIFPPARLASLRQRGAFRQVFYSALPVQTGFTAVIWLAGFFLHKLI